MFAIGDSATQLYTKGSCLSLYANGFDGFKRRLRLCQTITINKQQNEFCAAGAPHNCVLTEHVAQISGKTDQIFIAGHPAVGRVDQGKFPDIDQHQGRTAFVIGFFGKYAFQTAPVINSGQFVVLCAEFFIFLPLFQVGDVSQNPQQPKRNALLVSHRLEPGQHPAPAAVRHAHPILRFIHRG